MFEKFVFYNRSALVIQVSVQVSITAELLNSVFMKSSYNLLFTKSQNNKMTYFCSVIKMSLIR